MSPLFSAYLMMKNNAGLHTLILLITVLLATACGRGIGSPSGSVILPVDDDLSALSHAGKPLPHNAVNPRSSGLYSDVGRAKAMALPDTLAVVYEVVENHGTDAFDPNTTPNCQTLAADYASCSVTNLHIKDVNNVLGDGNWRLYFHSIRRILRVDSEEFRGSLVNGDLNYLEPTSAFKGFDDKVKTVGLVTEFNHLIESDFMPRYWLVRDEGEVSLISNTDEETDESSYAVAISGDNAKAFNGEPTPIASASSRFADNSALQSAIQNVSSDTVQARIIPRPMSVSVGTGALAIGGGFSFAGTELSAGSVAALKARQSLFMGSDSATPLSATIDPSMPAGQYTLDVSKAGITLTGADDTALFYAAQSLLSLVQPGVDSIPVVSIRDRPRFQHRGMHVDVARNFHSVQSIQRLLDQMAAYKLNKLHLHLSDDEGWRLQIAGLPELTDIGARRGFRLDAEGNVSETASLMPQLGSGPNSNNQGTGFYTSAQFVSLLQYAAARHIDIIPEFDMPAHARAAVVAMRARAVKLGDANDIHVRVDDPADSSRYLTIQHYDDGILNPCIPGTWRFIETLLAELARLYRQAGVTLDVFHMGGDEARNIFLGNGFQDFSASNRAARRGIVDQSLWDEPWEKSPACDALINTTAELDSRDDLQRYFIREVAQRVADAGIPALYAYHDSYESLSAGELATQRTGAGLWAVLAQDGSIDAINNFSNRGYETVLSVPDFLYFDFPQEANPQERGYYWATRFIDLKKVFSFAPENLPQNAETSVDREGRAWSASAESNYSGTLGMQGYLWSETVRTAEQFEYMIFPRLLALAERAWSRADWELDFVPGRHYSNESGLVDTGALLVDYASFTAALASKELPKLDAAGIRYRVPVPGASTEDGELHMNIEIPGLPLEYSIDGQHFIPWLSTVSANGVVAIRALSADGSRSGRVELLTP